MDNGTEQKTQNNKTRIQTELDQIRGSPTALSK